MENIFQNLVFGESFQIFYVLYIILISVIIPFVVFSIATFFLFFFFYMSPIFLPITFEYNVLPGIIPAK